MTAQVIALHRPRRGEQDHDQGSVEHRNQVHRIVQAECDDSIVDQVWRFEAHSTWNGVSRLHIINGQNGHMCLALEGAYDFAVPQRELRFFDRATEKRVAPRAVSLQ